MRILCVIMFFLVVTVRAQAENKVSSVKMGGKAKLMELVSFRNKFRLEKLRTGANQLGATLVNSSDLELELRIKASSAGKKYEDYLFDVKLVGVPEEWIKIGPNESIEIKFSVNVPAQANGAKAFRLGYELKEESLRGKGVVSINTDSFIIFNIEGKGRHKYSITDDIRQVRGRLVVSTSVKNEGTMVLYGAKLSRVILNSRGEKIFSDSSVKDFFLLGKGSKKSVEATLGAKLRPGKYSLMTFLSSGGDPQARAATKTPFEIGGDK